MKLIVLYRQPADPATFDQAFFNTHLPVLARVPGLQKTVVTRYTSSLSGEAFYLMAEMYFADKHTFKVAMRSPEMAAAGENLTILPRDWSACSLAKKNWPQALPRAQLSRLQQCEALWNTATWDKPV